MASRRQRGWAVPGFDLPLQWPRTRSLENKPHPISNEDVLLRSALDNSSDPAYCYTVRELTMLAWIMELTDLPQWHHEIFDPEFTFKWKSAKILTGGDVTRAMADWCVEEVRYYAIEFVNQNMIPVLDGGVIKSDNCVDEAIHRGLKLATAALRKREGGKNISHERKVDIVDPYLFPFAWDKTRLLRKGAIQPRNCIAMCGEGDTAKMPPEEDCKEPDHGRFRNDMAYSRRFQWLPFDVKFDDDGFGASRIQSYINDVHPTDHIDLYNVVGKLIDAFIPLFNRTIIDLKAPGYQEQRIHLIEFGREPFLQRDPGTFRPPEQRANDSFLDEYGRYQNFMFVDLKKEFWNIGLQMVLHLQDINLSPEHPECESQEWHVQGRTNERIIASASYIYSTANLSPNSPPKISFRTPVFIEEAMAAKGAVFTPPFLPEIYGVKHGDPAVQTLGSVTLREGRVVVWPNTFQTRILPFSLDDRNQAGHCRILTLHLVDPNRRIMSTSLVPCQRRDWWASAIRRSVPCFGRLPAEVFDTIIENVSGYPISLEEGLKIRKEFKSEMEEFRERHTRAMEEYEEWDFYGEPGTQTCDDGEWVYV